MLSTYRGMLYKDEFIISSTQLYKGITIISCLQMKNLRFREGKWYVHSYKVEELRFAPSKSI